VDLRSQGEIDRNGRFPYERVPVRWVHVVSPMGPPGGRDDERTRAFLEHPDPMSVLFKMMVTTGTSMFADALRVIGEPDAHPLVFHCTSGKDRTGMTAVLVQLLAGIEMEEILADFEHSAEAVRAAGHDMMARFPGIADMPPERVELLSGANRSWVLGAIEEIGGLGRLEGWFDGIGVDAALRASVRQVLLGPATGAVT
jgi:protein-tyrosine phosphatase